MRLRRLLCGRASSPADDATARLDRQLRCTRLIAMPRETRPHRAPRFAFAAVALLLSSCANRPVAFPDYCEAQERRLSQRERFSAALLHFYDRAEERGLRHFAGFRSRHLAANPSAEPRAVVAAYLTRFPDCCALAEPWPIRFYDTNTDLFGRNFVFEELYHDSTRDFRWAYDVLIGRDYSLDPEDQRTYVEIGVSDCGEFGGAGRG